MRKNKYFNFFLVCVLGCMLLLTGCGESGPQNEQESKKDVVTGSEEKISHETSAVYPKKIIDSLGREIVISKPIEKIITLGNYRCEAVKVLGAVDKLVGLDTNTKQGSAFYFPELLDKPDVGTWMQPNVEMIVKLRPDIVITSANEKRLTELEELLKSTDIVIAGFEFYKEDIIKDEIQKLGYLLEKENEARDYLNWRGHYENRINQYVKALNEDEKPKILMQWRPGSGQDFVYGDETSGHAMCTFSGGRNVAAEFAGSQEVSNEWILNANPDVCVRDVKIEENNWGWKNTEEPENKIAEIKNQPGWSKITAVENNKIYLMDSEIAWGLDGIIGAAYWAKWFHPSLDIDPQLMYKEFIERFMQLIYPDDLIIAYPAP